MFSNDSLPNGVIDFHEWDEGSFELNSFASSSNDTAFIPYTADGKGVRLSHKNLIANSEMIPRTRQTEDQETILCTHAISGASIIQSLISKLRIGSKILTLTPGYTPDTLAACIHRHQVSTVTLSPAMITILAQSSKIKSDHLASLRRIVCNAALLRDEDVQKVHEKVPNVVFSQTYGTPEVPVALMSKADENETGRQGLPMAATQVKVVDPNMKTLGPEEVGELLIRGPHVMKGYLNDEAATKEVLTDGKWFRTGDLARYDGKGKFFLSGKLQN